MVVSSRTVALALCVAIGTAHAQPAAAVAQFDKGRALMKSKQYVEACTAFAQSQTLDPQPGTLYNLAACQVQIGKLASAWAAFRELAQRDPNPARKKESAKQAAALEKRLPRLSITAAAPPAGLVVMLDGADVTAVVGVPSPIDLGTHEIRATAPSFKSFSTTTTISEEGKTTSVSVVLDAAPTEGVARVSPDGAPHQPPVEPPTPPASHSNRRLIGGAVMIGGVAIAAVGLVFGNQASGKWDDAKKLCPDRTCASMADLTAADSAASDARSKATLSTSFVIGGAVVLGVGAYLLFTGGSHAEHSETALRLAPTASRDGAGFVLDGAF